MSKYFETRKVLRTLVIICFLGWAFCLYFIFNTEVHFQMPIGVKNTEEIIGLIIQLLPSIILIYQFFKTTDKIGKIYWILFTIILSLGSLWKVVSYKNSSLQYFPYSFVSICLLLVLNVVFYQIHIRKNFRIFN